LKKHFLETREGMVEFGEYYTLMVATEKDCNGIGALAIYLWENVHDECML